MDTSSITTLSILNEIDNTWGGDTMDFIASFISYCNDETLFGAPRKVAPLNDDIVPSFGTITLQVCDRAVASGYAPFTYVVEPTENEYTVQVVPYLPDEETGELDVASWFFVTFDITDPYELKELCRYVGVEFQASYFDCE